MQISLPPPSEKQKLFLKDKHLHIAFGGARGGGKSFALRYKAIVLATTYSGIRVGIFRKTYPELYANHIKPFKKLLCIGQRGNPIRYNDSKKTITFPNGSEITFEYCNTDADTGRLQGQEFDVIMFDEATLFSMHQIDEIRATLRGVNGYPKHYYYTCNPNGMSLSYIKRLFIDRRFEESENPDDYVFIQSLLTDNKALMESDKNYLHRLETLPEKLKQAWLYGRWDVFEGQYFEEFRDKPDAIECEAHGISTEEALEYGRWTHVVEPFAIPSSWKIYRSYDWGYGKPFSVCWWAQSEDDTLYQIAEWYGCTKTPNEGIKLTNKEQADGIQKIEAELPILKGRKVSRGVADPSIWDGSHDTYGVSCAEEMDKHRIYFEKANNERVAGWMQFRERMKFDEEGYAKIYFFSNCKNSIRTIPLQIYDEHKPEDLDTSLEDHACDSIRYMCMDRPIPPRDIKKKTVPISDPLNQFVDLDKTQFSKYNGIRRT